ncbi:surface lipoprotein assembly modifier [Martelella soudanensis]|uniref:surface lipoprotein assembly modifier n=1 Tax=unclassified Martelella TaxID=2629616 RepID=UPI0015DE6AA7|nr:MULTISPECIES: surface lipoprotein assembly modifier [unclassified Martelella]
MQFARLILRLKRMAVPAMLALVIGLSGGAAVADNPFPKIKGLIESGQYDQAMALSAHLTRDPELSALSQKFTYALILKRQGQLKQAAGIMRKILAEKPDLSRVRQELAHTLSLMGEKKAAIYHFSILADNAPSESLRSFYEDFIDRVNLDRPWTLGGYVAIAPSTNISNATDQALVHVGGIPLTPGDKAESGVGLNYGANGTYTFQLVDDLSLTFGGSITGLAYKETVYNQTQFGGFSQLSWRMDPWIFSGGIAAEYVLMGNEPYRVGYGPVFSVRRSFGPWGVTSANVSYQWLDYDQNDAFDGYQAGISLNHRYALTPASSIRFGGGYNHVHAENDINSYNGYNLNAKYAREWSGGILTDIGVSGTLRDYVGDFPLMTEPRFDRRLDVELGATFRTLAMKGFAPRLEYAYSQNFSNVELYDYNKSTVSLFVTKQF